MLGKLFLRRGNAPPIPRSSFQEKTYSITTQARVALGLEYTNTSFNSTNGTETVVNSNQFSVDSDNGDPLKFYYKANDGFDDSNRVTVAINKLNY